MKVVKYRHMDKSSDIKAIVYIIKEVVKGYYAIIQRDTNSYNIQKFNKEDFIAIFKGDNQQWHIECDADLTRLLLTDSNDTISVDSDLVKTFNSYEVEGEVKIARVSIVCDWSIFELAFDGKTPQEVLDMVLSEKIRCYKIFF